MHQLHRSCFSPSVFTLCCTSLNVPPSKWWLTRYRKHTKKQTGFVSTLIVQLWYSVPLGLLSLAPLPATPHHTYRHFMQLQKEQIMWWTTFVLRQFSTDKWICGVANELVPVLVQYFTRWLRGKRQQHYRSHAAYKSRSASHIWYLCMTYLNFIFPNFIQFCALKPQGAVWFTLIRMFISFYQTFYTFCFSIKSKWPNACLVLSSFAL